MKDAWTVTGPYKYSGELHSCFRIDAPERIVGVIYAVGGDEERAEREAYITARAICSANAVGKRQGNSPVQSDPDRQVTGQDLPTVFTSVAVEAGWREAAQIAFDQQCDHPEWTGSWNDACIHIAKLLRNADRQTGQDLPTVSTEVDAVIKRFEQACVDWDGSRMVDGAEPKDIPTCRQLREAAVLLAWVQAELSEEIACRIHAETFLGERLAKRAADVKALTEVLTKIRHTVINTPDAMSDSVWLLDRIDAALNKEPKP